MPLAMPPLHTDRLIVRPFTMDDLADAHDLFDEELADADVGTDGILTIADRERWLRWTTLNYGELASLHQPPYGDRAVVLRDDGRLIGSCGYVPSLGPFDQLPSYGSRGPDRPLTPEVGLFYALAPRWRGRGYATEAARALIDYAFRELRLARVIATTTYENKGSQNVMERLGMRIERNPYPDPPWFQVVGTLDNPDA
jgi:RimJ/RimL family protein N-acetyltransferase